MLLQDFLLSIHDVRQIAGLSRTTIYEMIREGRFPAPIKISMRASRWKKSQIEAWLASLKTDKGTNHAGR